MSTKGFVSIWCLEVSACLFPSKFNFCWTHFISFVRLLAFPNGDLNLWTRGAVGEERYHRMWVSTMDPGFFDFHLVLLPNWCSSLWNFQSGGLLEAGCYFKVGLCFHICNIVKILLFHRAGSPKKREVIFPRHQSM